MSGDPRGGLLVDADSSCRTLPAGVAGLPLDGTMFQESVRIVAILVSGRLTERAVVRDFFRNSGTDPQKS